MPSADFLSTLDAFYYRTHPAYFEAFGRVVLEAMLCGIPVVAEARGGYASHIRHGENGFLFDDPRDAHGAARRAASRPGTARADRPAAHATAQRLFRDDLPERTRRALLSDPRPLALGGLSLESRGPPTVPLRPPAPAMPSFATSASSTSASSALAVLLLNLTPGPDTAFIVGQSVAHGRRTGLMSVLGISAGCVVHTIALALGLSAHPRRVGERVHRDQDRRRRLPRRCSASG